MFDPRDYQSLRVTESPIPGLFIVDLVINGDKRGWFKENYQAEKLEALGLPHFNVVQNNFSFNSEKGVTRGLHAEPWEKYISVANGRVFGAWVDLRNGPTFGKTFTTEINPGKAIFVSRGIANGYQALEADITYTYLVNEHWSPEAQYALVNLFDPELRIAWPIDKARSIVSDKDAGHPFLRDMTPLEF